MAGKFHLVSTPTALHKSPGAHSTLFCAVALTVILSLGVSGCSLGAGRTSGASPIVSTVTPNQGTVASAVKITGSNFGATQIAGDTVSFNGKSATIISWSDTAIVTDVPAGATTGNVVVGANGVTGAGINFTVLTGATAGCGTGSESVLSGTYAYEMSGFMGAGLGTNFARVGSFKANGSGVISGGDEDLNVGTLGDTHHTIVGGSYSIGADYRGCVTLNYGASSATFRFSLGTLSNTNVAARGHIIEFDDSSNNGAGSRASGVMLQQTVGSSTGASLLVNYAFGMEGADPTGGHVAIGGTFTLAPTLATDNITNAYLDYNDAASLRFAGTTNAAFGNMLTTGTNISATTGRTTATFSAQTACASTTCTYHWAVYVVNPNQMFLISTDTLSANTPLVSGRAISTLSPTSFTTASLSNANGYILEAGGSIAGIADAQLQQFKFNSIGNLFASAGWTYSVDVGHIVNTPISTPALLTGGYLVSTAGRLTFSNNNLVAYLTDPTVASGIAGFVIGIDASKPTAYSGLLITQQATNLSAGTYFVGTSDVQDNTVPSFVGAAGVQTTTQAPITSTIGGAIDVSRVGGLSSTTFSNQSFNFSSFTTPGLGTFADAAGNTMVGIADGTALFYIEETTSGTPVDPAAVVVIDQ